MRDLDIIFSKLIEKLGDDDATIKLLVDFVERSKDKNPKELVVLFNNIFEDLAKMQQDEDSRIQKTLQFSLVEHYIKEFETAKLARIPNKSLLLFQPAQSSVNSLISSTANTTMDEIIFALSTEQLLSNPEEIKVLDKPYIFNDGVQGCMQVSSNAAIFKLKANNFEITLDECWCDSSVSRTNPHNIRALMENNIVKTIVSNKKFTYDNHIRLINLGSDRIGLLIILSKLFLLGFKNIDVINLEINDAKNYTTYKDEDQNYAKILREIFSNNISYKTIIQGERGLNSHIMQDLRGKADITVVFGEDLGGIDKPDYSSKYKEAILAVLSELYSIDKDYRKNLFYSERNGEIIENLQPISVQNLKR